MKTTVRRQPDRKAIFAQFATKAVVQSKERTFEGLLSTWEQDTGNDVVERGAFARTLGIWKASPSLIIPLIDQHGYDSVRRVVGKLEDAKEEDAGLWTKWQVVPGNDGDEVLARVEGAFINGLSIGYSAVKWETEQPEGTTDPWDRIRHITELKLFEGSLVIWGMNEGALIDPTSVKSLLAQFKDRKPTDEEIAELKQLHVDLGALLQPAAPAAPEGLAPDDPKRIALEEALRAITLRSLGTV